MKTSIYLTFLVIIAMLPSQAMAETSLWIANGFYSHHFSSVNYNEDNVGIGASIAFDNGLSENDSLSFGTYINSESKRSNYLTYKWIQLQERSLFSDGNPLLVSAV